MTPPRRDPIEEARKRLDEAAGAIDRIRRLTGALDASGAPPVSASESVRREALDAARDDLRRMAAELEAARAAGAALSEEVGRLRAELTERPTARELADARAAGETDSARRAAELAQQVVGLKERVSLLNAEHVRLETLRRKAEAFGADSEGMRREMEKTLRRELLAAHASLDRAAAESGVRDAKAITEIETLRKRLDQALERLQREARRDALHTQQRDEESAYKSDFEASQAVIASLRRELAQQREDALKRENALELRAHELENRLSQALSPHDAALLKELEGLRAELGSRPMAADLEEARAAEAKLRWELRVAHASLGRTGTDAAAREAEAAGQAAELRKRLELEEAARKQASTDAYSYKSELAAAQGVVASLRRELSELRAAAGKAEAYAEAREAEAADLSAELLKRTEREERTGKQASADAAAAKNELAAAQGVIESLRLELSEQRERLAKHAELRMRLDREELAEKQANAEAAAFKYDLVAAQGVIDELRRELTDQRSALGRAGTDAASFKNDAAAAQGVIDSLRRELSEHRASALSRERALEQRVDELERSRPAPSASASPPPPPPPPMFPSLPEPAAEAETDAFDEPPVEYPPMEFALDPGWARLLRLIKPPLQAAYGHLRRLSAGPMSAGQRAILRLTGSSLSQAADSLATIELALADSPAAIEAAPVLPVLDAALSAWEPVLRRRGVVLSRDVSYNTPDAPFDPEQLRLVLHHVLRNAVEALPRGANLRVKLSGSKTDAVLLEFLDDGPGYPAAWLERRFEPFASPRAGHAGLGLAAVRRALRRWGGDAEASNALGGRGACLVLTFAPAPARPASNP